MKIPEKADRLFDKGLILAMATVDSGGEPNVAPMLQYWRLGEDRLVIGDLFMKATRDNVQKTRRVCLSLCDEKTGEAYKYRGEAAYETEGPAFDIANKALQRKKPDKQFKGVVVVRMDSVFVATRGKKAGEKIAEGV